MSCATCVVAAGGVDVCVYALLGIRLAQSLQIVTSWRMCTLPCSGFGGCFQTGHWPVFVATCLKVATHGLGCCVGVGLSQPGCWRLVVLQGTVCAAPPAVLDV